MKYFVHYLAIAGILIALVFYLNSHSLQNDPLPKTMEDKLTIWVQDSFNGSETYFETLAKTYEEKYPQNKIEILVIQGSDDHVYNIITKKTLNGVIPDVLLLSTQNYNTFATEKKLESMDAYLATYPTNYFLPSVYEDAYYKNQLFGLAYTIDPEVFVYNKDHLNTISDFEENMLDSSSEFLSLAQRLQVRCTAPSTVALSIPTLTQHGAYVNTLLGFKEVLPTCDIPQLNQLAYLYASHPQTAYNYNKNSSHNFFAHETLLSIEPLSLVYSSISTDYNLKETIGIFPIGQMLQVHADKSYATIFKASDKKTQAKAFLDLLFSEQEIVQRYRFYDLPVICYSKQPLFVNSLKFNNTNVWPYLVQNRHLPLSTHYTQDLAFIDNLYESKIYTSFSSEVHSVE